MPAFVEAKLQKNFQFFYDNEKEYVVVYRNKDCLVLEEAIADEKDLLIIRSKQRYITSDDIQLEYRHFENVKKTDTITYQEDIKQDNTIR